MVAPARGLLRDPGPRHATRCGIAYVLKQADLRLAARVLEVGLATYRTARGHEGLEAVAAGAEPDFHIPDN